MINIDEHQYIESPLKIIKQQKSHLLFVLFNKQDLRNSSEFLNWYRSEYSKILSSFENVLSIRQLEQHEIDVTKGEYQKLPYHYLSLIELSLDGAEQAKELINYIIELHESSTYAGPPATWLYYPICERVGRPAKIFNPMLTLAFANAVSGRELEFREWYCTRHIRHALNVQSLVSGQCFGLTRFQRSVSEKSSYGVIAVYEQEGTPEEMIESFESLPDETFEFPALDLNRFAEWVYKPIAIQG